MRIFYFANHFKFITCDWTYTYHGFFSNQNFNTFKKQFFITQVVCKVRCWGNAREAMFLGTAAAMAGRKAWRASHFTSKTVTMQRGVSMKKNNCVSSQNHGSPIWASVGSHFSSVLGAEQKSLVYPVKWSWESGCWGPACVPASRSFSSCSSIPSSLASSLPTHHIIWAYAASRWMMVTAQVLR